MSRQNLICCWIVVSTFWLGGCDLPGGGSAPAGSFDGENSPYVTTCTIMANKVTLEPGSFDDFATSQELLDRVSARVAPAIGRDRAEVLLELANSVETLQLDANGREQRLTVTHPSKLWSRAIMAVWLHEMLIKQPSTISRAQVDAQAARVKALGDNRDELFKELARLRPLHIACRKKPNEFYERWQRMHQDVLRAQAQGFLNTTNALKLLRPYQVLNDKIAPADVEILLRELPKCRFQTAQPPPTLGGKVYQLQMEVRRKKRELGPRHPDVVSLEQRLEVLRKTPPPPNDALAMQPAREVNNLLIKVPTALPWSVEEYEIGQQIEAIQQKLESLNPNLTRTANDLSAIRAKQLSQANRKWAVSVLRRADYAKLTGAESTQWQQIINQHPQVDFKALR